MHKAKMDAYKSGIAKVFGKKNETRVIPRQAQEEITALINDMKRDDYYPRRYNPIHEVKDWGKVEKIVKGAMNGDDIQPFLIDGQPGNGNLLSGTHRAAANDVLREVGGPEIGYIELDDLPSSARSKIVERIDDLRTDEVDDIFNSVYPKTKPKKTQARGEPVDFGKVSNMADKVMTQGKFKGVDISESTAAVRTKIQSRLDQWAKLDPAEFHTVEGMDALRKSIGDVVDSAPYGTPERRLANEVYFAVRKSVEAQAPGYGKVLKGYHEASKHLKRSWSGRYPLARARRAKRRCENSKP